LRHQVADRIRATPGVVTVSEARQIPLSGNMGNTSVILSDRQMDHPFEARFNFVSPEYFEALQIMPVRGRLFSAPEVSAGMPVAVISAATAQRYWLGADPIGKHLGIPVAADQAKSNGEEKAAIKYKQYEVIGVVRDARS